MFILNLNDMRCNTEHNKTVARSETKEGLIKYLESETVEPYQDEAGSVFHSGPYNYQKTFRKGGPLEWFNPPSPDGEGCGYSHFVDVGTLTDRIEILREHWENQILSLQEV